MARQVTVTITYDMDDEGKTLEDELRDWAEGNVSVADVDMADPLNIVSIQDMKGNYLELGGLAFSLGKIKS